jgi:ADP-ribosyl-[dinitrogen reductase] hydrolase
MDWRQALEVAVRAAREGGELLRRDFHLPGGARGERDKAEADTEAEHLIRGQLLAAFPAWGYHGEETGSVSAPGQPVWLVDPNDGTRDYLKGWRGSSVSIGIAYEGRPRLGVVYSFGYPDDTGEMFAWAEGCGPLTRDGVAVDTRLEGPLTPDSVVLLSSNADKAAEAYFTCVKPARYRSVPSIAHRLARLAAGEVEGVVSLFAPGAWDYGAGHALVLAVGGVLVDEQGAEVTYAEDGQSRTVRLFAGSREVCEELRDRPWERVSRAVRPWATDKPARLERGHAIADPGLLSRAQGCLLGQIAGDSLGALVEFQGSHEIAVEYPDGPRELRDGGTWDTLGGQPTDDSEMAIALARSIVEGGGYDPEVARARYGAWLASGPFDVGTTTRKALTGHATWDSQANGSLMRCSPLGVFGHALPTPRLVAMARADSAITHPHPACGDAVSAYCVAVAHAVRHGDGARAAYDAALSWARGAGAEASVIQALEEAALEPPVCDKSQIGWVLIALRNAVYELLHAPSLEEGVVRTVRRGGDTDTNAAIAGALLGAVHGRASVPPQWQRQVLSCRPHPLRARRPRPMTFWPVDVLEMAERLLLAGRSAASAP